MNQKDRKSKDNLGRCYKVVQQSGARGIRAKEIAEQLELDRTTVHRHLTYLDSRGKVESKSGFWHAITEELTVNPPEKEIVIELPLPKGEWRQVALLELLAKDCESENFPEVAEIYRIVLEKFKETRTIKIRGKNVDDIDLEKVQNLILQASHKSPKIDFKGFIKSLKKSRPEKSQGK